MRSCPPFLLAGSQTWVPDRGRLCAPPGPRTPCPAPSPASSLAVSPPHCTPVCLYACKHLKAQTKSELASYLHTSGSDRQSLDSGYCQRDSMRLEENGVSYNGPFCGRALVHTDFTPSPYDVESLKLQVSRPCFLWFGPRPLLLSRQVAPLPQGSLLTMFLLKAQFIDGLFEKTISFICSFTFHFLFPLLCFCKNDNFKFASSNWKDKVMVYDIWSTKIVIVLISIFLELKTPPPPDIWKYSNMTNNLDLNCFFHKTKSLSWLKKKKISKYAYILYLNYYF